MEDICYSYSAGTKILPKFGGLQSQRFTAHSSKCSTFALLFVEFDRGRTHSLKQLSLNYFSLSILHGIQEVVLVHILPSLYSWQSCPFRIQMKGTVISHYQNISNYVLCFISRTDSTSSFQNNS